jgi:heme exporter protein D
MHELNHKLVITIYLNYPPYVSLMHTLSHIPMIVYMQVSISQKSCMMNAITSRLHPQVQLVIETKRFHKCLDCPHWGTLPER